MNRVEENSKLKFANIRHDNANGTDIAKVKFLEDISRSLAAIADVLYKGEDDTKEADSYVRDHLLIEWMLNEQGIRWDNDVEDTYSDWEKWLKKEEAHE